MLDTPTSENYRDFHQRYSHTFGWLITKDKPDQFVQILDLDDNSVNFKTSKDGPTYYAKVNGGAVFKFQQVERGLYRGLDGLIWYLARIPARQWKRGVCKQNTQLQFLDSNNFYNPDDRGFDSFANVLCNEQRYEYQENEYEDTLISKHFCVSSTGSVFFYNRAIGSADKNGSITLNQFGAVVKQELQDALRRNKWEVIYHIKDVA